MFGMHWTIAVPLNMLALIDNDGVVHVRVHARMLTTLCEDPNRNGGYRIVYAAIDLAPSDGMVTCAMCLCYSKPPLKGKLL